MGTTQTDESAVQKSDSAPETQAPSQTKEPSSQTEETTPKPATYTQGQVDKMLNLERSMAGRDWKTLQTELDNVKKQLAQKDATETGLKDEISELNKQIESLASDDPAKFDAIKERKAAREKLRDLQGRETALQAREQSLKSRLEKAEAKERDDLILEVAEEYQNCDTDKFTKLCVKYGVKEEVDIREIAETFWVKKGTNVYVDTGRSSAEKKALRGDEALKAGLEEERKRVKPT